MHCTKEYQTDIEKDDIYVVIFTVQKFIIKLKHL